MYSFIASILFIVACADNSDNDFRKNIDDKNENFISSEKLNYKVDTIATGLNNPWGLTFLPNNDLLVTERDGEIRIIRDDKLLDNKISGVPEVYDKGQGGLFEIQLHPDYETNGWL
ncbi:MAG: PQQ-dependent sugar dehydrogenase, partial [Cyclobacteriaceae bacterium]|nr:PQQ-dependent sugar dehydrogenase [Cyclobacteriaceae bacterium]